MIQSLFRRQPPLLQPTQDQKIALQTLASRLPTLNWAAIGTDKGLAEAIYDPFSNEHPDRIASMAAAILALGERISSELHHGRMTHAIISGSKGIFLAHAITPNHILVASLPAGTEIEPALAALRDVAATLQDAGSSETHP